MSQKALIIRLIMLTASLAIVGTFLWLKRPAGGGDPYANLASMLPAPALPADFASADIGTAAWDWSLTNLDGNDVPFDTFRGRPVFLNFWATWCGPCMAEMPAMARMYEALTDHEDLAFAFISNEDPAMLKRFVSDQGWPFPVYAVRGTPPSVYQTQGIPMTMIIDRAGTVVFKEMGAARWDDPKAIDLIGSL